MKSLQVTTPSKKCSYNCPFCIAKTHPHNNQFSNLYEDDFEKWAKNYMAILLDNPDLKNIVITGTNEPMQDPECVEKIIELTRFFRNDIAIELQTRQYSFSELYSKLDVVAYSISQYSYLARIKPNGKINRYVILLTDEFANKSLEEILSQLPSTVTQVTFKVLQDNGGNAKVESWIRTHKMKEEQICLLEEQILQYKGKLSIRLDRNCMDATNRYEIYREDGNLYRDWDEKVKIR